ncbi:MAG TPA: hypothetical protein DCS07_09295 [Bdellovibrionales bacterium]|nr:hypothetical protein [Bdellovibrionales bacterium]
MSVTQFQDNLFETDTTQLRDKTSLESGSGYYSRYLDEIFQRYISPVVILPSSIRNAEAISRKLKAEQKKDGPNGDFAGIYSLGDLVPRQQRAKIQVLREIRSALIPALQAQLNPRDRRLARSFLQKENFTPFTAADLPESIRARFREINGTTGKLVLVEPRVEREISRSGAYQTRFISKVRQITDSVEPGAPVVGQLPLTVDMQQSIRRDGPRATLVAAGAVTILVLILFRDVRTSGFVLLSLLLGMSWLAGSLFQWVIKINFLNFIAIPITFGIGVDYAINTLQRYRLEGPGSIMKALRTTGGAVALESLTTIIGYGSLLIAGNQGFVSFGKIAIIGEITCLFAALLTVPALIYLLDLHRRQTVQKLPIQEQERRKAA